MPDDSLVAALAVTVATQSINDQCLSRHSERYWEGKKLILIRPRW
jgi:hypothetical protein